MAEILNEGINRFDVDSATQSGNTVLGSAVPTNESTEGLSKSAGDSGVFIYTDKSFSVYMCYGGTWELYDSIDASAADLSGGASIPWVTHSTHGAATSMYFQTAESDHTIRTMKIETALITDYTPGDGVFSKDTLILKDTEVIKGQVLSSASNVGIYYRKGHSMSGKVAGDTFSYELNGIIAGALTFMDGGKMIKTTLSYSAETGKTTVSFVLPDDYTNQTISTHTRGGSPMSDPFTRAVAIPTSGLIWDINVSEDSRKSDGTFPSDGEATPAFVGTANAVTTTGNPIRYSSVYQWGDGGANISVTSPFLDFTNNTKMRPNGTLDWSSGEATVAFAWVNGWKNHGGFSDIRLKDETNNLSINIHTHGTSIGYDAATNKYKMRVTFMLASGNKFHYISDDYVLDNTKVNTVIITAKSDGELVVKIDGNIVSMTLEGTGPVYSGIEINGHFHLGDLVIYNSVLSGTDLEQLEAYFDFKYINYADSEVMWNEANWNDIHGFHSQSPPGQTPTSLTGYNTAQHYWNVRTEKMFKVGSRTEIKYTSDTYVYNGPHQIFITDDLEWQSKNKQYGYYYNDMKSTSAGYLFRLASNYLYIYESDGAGNMPLVFNANAGNLVTDEISFIVEWDGTCKVAKNGTVLATLPTKFTVGNHYAPFLVNQRDGEGSLSIEGNLVDWAWPSTYSSETAIDATPTYVSGNAQVSGNHINYGENPMGKGGRVKVATLQGEGAYVDWQPHPYHLSNKFYMTLSTTPDVFTYNDANAEIGFQNSNTANGYVYTSGTVDHLMTRKGLCGFTGWADYYNDISNSYEGDEHINRYSFRRLRIQFYDDHVIFWSNGYPIYRIDGIDTSLQYEFNIDMYDVTWSPGFEDIKIYNP